MVDILCHLKGKMPKSFLLSERQPKCELCEATRDSLRPWWSYVARRLLLNEISVWPPKYLIMKPPHTTEARPMAAQSGTIAWLYQIFLMSPPWMPPLGISCQFLTASSQPMADR